MRTTLTLAREILQQSEQLLPARRQPPTERSPRPAMPRREVPLVTSRKVRQGSRRRLVLGSALALMVLVLGAWLGWRYWAGAEAEPGYATATVGRATIEDVVSALGNIQPRDYVDVGTQVSGQLKTIRVAIGDTVKSGDLLA